MRLFQVSLTGQVWPKQLLVEAEHISEVPERVLKRVHHHGKFEFRLIRWVGFTTGDAYLRPKPQVVQADQPQVGQDSQPSE